MNEEDIRKGIEILQDAVKDNRGHSKQFIIGENELIVTLNTLHRAIDLEKELQQEKEKNKKLEEVIDIMAGVECLKNYYFKKSRGEENGNKN